jgi:hypothetical protein
MSDSLHRAIEDLRDTRTDAWTSHRKRAFEKRGPPSLRFGATAFDIAGPPSRSRGAAKAGGARRDRTDDLLLAKQALSQLSYGPVEDALEKVVGLGRLELPTSRLSSARSNQLSYKPPKP